MNNGFSTDSAPPIINWHHVNVHYGYLFIKARIRTFNGLIVLIGFIHISKSLCGMLIGINVNSRENGIVSPSVLSMIETIQFLFIQKNFIIAFQMEIQIAITKLSKGKDILYIWLPIIVFSKELNDYNYVAFNERIWQSIEQILKDIWTVITWIESHCQTHIHYNHPYVADGSKYFFFD